MESRGWFQFDRVFVNVGSHERTQIATCNRSHSVLSIKWQKMSVIDRKKGKQTNVCRPSGPGMTGRCFHGQICTRNVIRLLHTTYRARWPHRVSVSRSPVLVPPISVSCSPVLAPSTLLARSTSSPVLPCSSNDTSRGTCSMRRHPPAERSATQIW